MYLAKIRKSTNSLALLIAGIFVAVNANAQVSFAPPASYGVGNLPESVVAVDVNGDGKLDLVSANAHANTLSILTNDGSGGFLLASSPVVGNWPESLTTADVNGTGNLSLICANQNDNTLSVLTNNGSGGFLLAHLITVGSNPHSVVAADVNGDGKVDLITANMNGNSLSVLTNDGLGGFVLSSSPAVGNGPWSVTAADVNGDGKMDLICVDYWDLTLSVLTNNGRGGFILATLLNTGSKVTFWLKDSRSQPIPGCSVHVLRLVWRCDLGRVALRAASLAGFFFCRLVPVTHRTTRSNLGPIHE